MRGMVLLLVILGLLILNNRQKKHIHEGFTQCDYDIGDINQDGTLDIIDIIEMVNFVLSNDNNAY